MCHQPVLYIFDVLVGDPLAVHSKPATCITHTPCTVAVFMNGSKQCLEAYLWADAFQNSSSGPRFLLNDVAVSERALAGILCREFGALPKQANVFSKQARSRHPSEMN